MKYIDIAMEFKELKFMDIEYKPAFSILPRWCSVTGRFIRPFSTAVVRLESHRFLTNNPTRHKWLHGEEYLLLKLRGKIE